MNIIRYCKVYLTENSQKISHNIYLARLFYSVRAKNTYVHARRTQDLCQVKILDSVTIVYLHTCIHVYSLNINNALHYHAGRARRPDTLLNS